MNTHVNKAQGNQNKAAANESSQKKADTPSESFLEDNRQEAIQMKSWQDMADSSSLVQLSNHYQKIADHSARQSIQDNDTKGSKVDPANAGVVQRVLQVQGAAQSVAQVTAHFHGTADAITPAQSQILQNWSSSATIHNFRPSQGRTAWEKIPLALGRAEAMPAAPPPLFRAANLQFITQSGARLATLYFTGGGQTGRLRQQHGSGPLAEVDPHAKTRISFPNLADRTAYVNALRISRDTPAVFADPVPGTYNTPPVPGEELLEYYMAGGGIAGGWHPSEGLVQATPPALNNDVAITGIYNNIIGVDPDDGCCCCGCFITTACVMAKGLPDNCEELETLREYRDNYLLKLPNGEELFRFYYTYSPAILRGINSSPDPLAIYNSLFTVIRQCVSCIRRRDLEEAFRIYVKMVLHLRDVYAPETMIPAHLMKILQGSQY